MNKFLQTNHLQILKLPIIGKQYPNHLNSILGNRENLKIKIEEFSKRYNSKSEWSDQFLVEAKKILSFLKIHIKKIFDLITSSKTMKRDPNLLEKESFSWEIDDLTYISSSYYFEFHNCINLFVKLDLNIQNLYYKNSAKILEFSSEISKLISLVDYIIKNYFPLKNFPGFPKYLLTESYFNELKNLLHIIYIQNVFECLLILKKIQKKHVGNILYCLSLCKDNSMITSEYSKYLKTLMFLGIDQMINSDNFEVKDSELGYRKLIQARFTALTYLFGNDYFCKTLDISKRYEDIQTTANSISATIVDFKTLIIFIGVKEIHTNIEDYKLTQELFNLP